MNITRWLQACSVGVGFLTLQACGGEQVQNARAVSPRPLQPVTRSAVQPDEASVEPAGPLTRDRIAYVIAEHEPAIGGCHTVQFSGKPLQPGSVTLLLTIEPDGSVVKASISESSFDSRDFSQCVLSVARGLSFPRASTETEVAWLFKFAAANGVTQVARTY